MACMSFAKSLSPNTYVADTRPVLICQHLFLNLIRDSHRHILIIDTALDGFGVANMLKELTCI